MFGVTVKRILCASLVVVLASCGGVKSTTEYKELEKEVAEIESEIAELEAKVVEGRSAATRLEGLKEERENLRKRFGSLMEDSATRKQVVSSFGIAACTRYSQAREAAAGLVDYDYDTNETYWNKVWELVNPADLILGDTSSSDDDTVGAKAYAAALNATGCEDKASDAFYEKCETFDKLVMKKNPEIFKGKCVKGTVRIAQFDANTGPCAFQGYLGGGYEVRAQFGETLSPSTHDSVKQCNWTQALVEGKSFTFWGWGLGAFSYNTTSGGAQTVPAFKMVMWQ